MYIKKLETILEEEWLKAENWHSSDINDQKRFHLALQRAYDELEYPPTHKDFLVAVDNVVKDPSMLDHIKTYSTKAETLLNYFRMIR